MSALNNTTHFKTDVDVDKLGNSAAEVCFIGRSNVGKSSLINAVCQKKALAFSSQIPGKTRTLNVYEVKPGRWLVDLPGYGFAVGGEKAKEELGALIESYLTGRDNLCMVVMVIDAVAGPTKLDFTMLGWLRFHDFAYSIVVHKIDKIASPKLEGRKKEIAQELEMQISDLYWISSSKKLGVTQLQTSIKEWLQL